MKKIISLALAISLLSLGLVACSPKAKKDTMTKAKVSEKNKMDKKDEMKKDDMEKEAESENSLEKSFSKATSDIFSALSKTIAFAQAGSEEGEAKAPKIDYDKLQKSLDDLITKVKESADSEEKKVLLDYFASIKQMYKDFADKNNIKNEKNMEALSKSAQEIAKKFYKNNLPDNVKSGLGLN